MVALNVSAAVEGYWWTTPALFSLVMVAAGKVVVFWRGAWPRSHSA